MKWFRKLPILIARPAIPRRDWENLLLFFSVLGMIVVYKLLRLGAFGQW